LKQSTITPES